MVRKNIVFIAAIAAGIATVGTAEANVEINSFENTLNGYSVPSTGDTGFALSGFSTTTGVTDGSYSVAYSPSATNTGGGPNYSQAIESPGYTVALTDDLATATAISVDVFAPAGSFGGYLQVNAAVQSQPNYNYDEIGSFSDAYSAVLGQETTITYQLTANALADIATAFADGVGTELSLSIGGSYTAGNETAYFDNLQAISPTVATPEPVSLGLIILAAPALLRRRQV